MLRFRNFDLKKVIFLVGGRKKLSMLSWSGLWLLLCLLNLVDVVALVLFLVVSSCRRFAIAAIVVCVSKP